MPFKLATRDHVIYLAWHGFVPDELRDAALRVTEHKRACGRNVVYVAGTPGGGGLLSDEQSASLLEFLLAILPACAALHHIIAGDGFIKSARRAMLTNLANATPRARDFHAHETLDAAAVAVRTLYGVDLRELVGDSPPLAPMEPERASGAFRAASRIFEGRRSRKE